jgi:hypothetical protein
MISMSNREEPGSRPSWWVKRPWRQIQTNLREIDMNDINAEQSADETIDILGKC